MTDVSMSRVAHHDVDTCAGNGHAARSLAFWLGLAAAPTFTIMALWSAFVSDQPDMLCMAIQRSSPMSEMTMMYLLMSAFHLSPWLKLISSRRNGISLLARRLSWRPHYLASIPLVRGPPAL